MKKIFKRSSSANLLCASALALLGAAPLSALACGDTPFVGEICTFAFNYCPVGFLPANGSLQSINTYNALFALLGNQFGGDGRTTFGLPDLRARVVAGTGTSPDAGVGTVNWGQKDGSSTVTLNANNLPQHTHPAAVAAGSLSGTASLAVSGGTVSGQTINGSVTVNALNGDNPPSGGVNIPTSSANTVGKTGSSQNFYPQGTNKVAVPTTHNLTVSGGTVSGATAGGTVTLPAAASTTAVSVGANTTSNTPVTITPARLGLTVCIATNGIWPTKP